MATASFRLTVDSGQVADVLRALAVEVRTARSRPSCIDCRIERDLDLAGGIRFHSRWDGVSGLRAFLASDVTTRLLQLLELSVEEPELLICWGDSEVGLNSLREIRGAIASGSGPMDSVLSGCGCESRPEPSNSFSFRE